MSNQISSPWGLEQIVAALRESREQPDGLYRASCIRKLPSRAEAAKIVSGLCAALFPAHYGEADLHAQSVDYYVGFTLEHTLQLLLEQVRRALSFLPESEHLSQAELHCRALSITRDFSAQLPQIHAVLMSDIQAAYVGDPAAQSLTEILLCYPGIYAITHHRFAHALYRLGVPLLARLINEIAHAATGIDIHPGARIGQRFFIDHGTGVVIGETAIIGEGVRLYQAVTLGAKNFPIDGNGMLEKGHARHPVVEDNVVIYAGATILGRVTIGQGSIIGGNVWLTHSVPPGTSVSQGKIYEEGQGGATAKQLRQR